MTTSTRSTTKAAPTHWQVLRKRQAAEQLHAAGRSAQPGHQAVQAVQLHFGHLI